MVFRTPANVDYSVGLGNCMYCPESDCLRPVGPEFCGSLNRASFRSFTPAQKQLWVRTGKLPTIFPAPVRNTSRVAFTQYFTPQQKLQLMRTKIKQEKNKNMRNISQVRQKQMNPVLSGIF